MALIVDLKKTSSRTLQAEVYSKDCTNVSGYYELITIWVDGKEVDNFDGVSELPEELQAELTKQGYFGF